VLLRRVGTAIGDVSTMPETGDLQADGTAEGREDDVTRRAATIDTCGDVPLEVIAW